MGLTPEALAASIRDAEERKARALAQYQQATAELAWLHQGLRLLGKSESAAEPSVVTEIFPATELFESGGVQPTLRQAIVAVMRPNPTEHWRAGDLAAELVRRNWLSDTPEATKRVSDMAALMVGDEQLTRPARGTYALAPQLTAEFELAGWPASDFASRDSERPE